MSEMCDRNIEGNEHFPHLHAMSTAAEMPMVLSRNVHTKMAIRGAMIEHISPPKGTFLKMIFSYSQGGRSVSPERLITPSFLSSGWIVIIIALHGIFMLLWIMMAATTACDDDEEDDPYNASVQCCCCGGSMTMSWRNDWDWLFSNGPKTHQKCLFFRPKDLFRCCYVDFLSTARVCGLSAFFPEQHPPIQRANCHEAHRKKSQNLKEKTMKALYVPWAH